MSKRLNKQQADIVKRGLISQLPRDRYIHPNRIKNEFEGIWINDAQKRAYLDRLAKKGIIKQAYHERGWYRYYSYKQSDEE